MLHLYSLLVMPFGVCVPRNDKNRKYVSWHCLRGEADYGTTTHRLVTINHSLKLGRKVNNPSIIKLGQPNTHAPVCWPMSLLSLPFFRAVQVFLDDPRVMTTGICICSGALWITFASTKRPLESIIMNVFSHANLNCNC